MSQSLDELLQTIDPDRVLDELANRGDQAINTFKEPAARIEDWEAFRQYLVRFLGHLDMSLLRMTGKPKRYFDHDWEDCRRLLRRDFGGNAEKAAFEIARTGNEGGLYNVLKTLARERVADFADNEIGGRVWHWFDAQSARELYEAATKYFERFGHLLPSELTESNAARLRTGFLDVLRHHPYMVRKLRQVGR